MAVNVGDRIRALREAAGMQAQELATRVDLDPTAISKIENGKRAIKTRELTRIADALGVSPLALLESDPLLSNLPLAARRAGPSIATGGAYKRLVDLSELHVVLADAGIPTSPNLASVPDVSGLGWLEAGTKLADWAVSALPLEDVADQRLEALADAIEEKLRIDVLIEAYTDDALSGAAITDHSFPLIFVNSEFSRPRSLFTLAHELGHVLAGHRDDSIMLDGDLSGSTDIERMANVFAAAFLMPKSIVSAAVDREGRYLSTLIRLTYELGVSFESLVYRLHNLQMINSEGRDRLREIGWQRLISSTNLSGLGRLELGRLQSRGTAKPAARPPVLLLERAVEGFQKGIVSIRPVASLLGEDPEQLLAQVETDDNVWAAINELNSSKFDQLDASESEEAYFAGNPV